jgi:hypothetical protein
MLACQELSDNGGGNLRVRAIDRGPVLGQPRRAKELVNPGKNRGKIMVAMLVVGVMPMVESR